MNQKGVSTAAAVLAVLAGFILLIIMLFVLGRLLWGSTVRESEPVNPGTAATSDAVYVSAVDDVAGYRVPDGWQAEACENGGTLYLMAPDAEALRCDINPNGTISAGVTDTMPEGCEEPESAFVIGHTCSSAGTNGQRSLSQSITYSERSSFGRIYTIDRVIVGSDDSYVWVEYRHNGRQGSGDYDAAYKAFVSSISIR